jgi:hypothetical protein
MLPATFRFFVAMTANHREAAQWRRCGYWDSPGSGYASIAVDDFVVDHAPIPCE